jgi:hypothetical protein
MPKSRKSTAYGRVIAEINKELPPSHRKLHFYLAEEILHDWNGRCAICGIPLQLMSINERNSMHLMFYIPLKSGGTKDKSNIVPVCTTDKKRYKPTKDLREEIPDLNTFADLTERLAKAIIREENEEVIRRIKLALNKILEQISVGIKYRPFTDWEPEDTELLIEGENTIPDRIEEVVTKLAKEEDTEETKDKITNSVKQIATHKQYKILKKL